MGGGGENSTKKRKMSNYTYGEIDSETIRHILTAANLTSFRRPFAVADLGCGTCKVLLTSLIWAIENDVEVSRVVGVDRMDAYCREGRHIIDAFREIGESSIKDIEVDVRVGDIIREKDCWRNCDVIVVCSTCYDAELMGEIRDVLVREGKAGQYVFTLDKALEAGGAEPADARARGLRGEEKVGEELKKEGDELIPVLVGITEAVGSWGRAKGYLHRMIVAAVNDDVESARRREAGSTSTGLTETPTQR